MDALNMFVELPAPLVTSVTALIVGAVVFGINWLIVRFQFLSWLSNYAQEWGFLLAAAIVMWFQNAVPDIYAAVAIHALELLLAILAVVGGLCAFARSRGVQGFIQ